MEVWETIGLWRYPVPGSFLLAQFCLGILVGMTILVSSSVYLYLSDKDEQSENGYCSIGGQIHCLFKFIVLNLLQHHYIHSSNHYILIYCSPYSEKEETAVLIVAIIAWMLRKGSRAIVLVLIFSIASRHGFFHALYSKLNEN